MYDPGALVLGFPLQTLEEHVEATIGDQFIPRSSAADMKEPSDEAEGPLELNDENYISTLQTIDADLADFEEGKFGYMASPTSMTIRPRDSSFWQDWSLPAVRRMLAFWK